MPWGDGTGPMGQGPMTGRAAGYCAGYNMPGFMNPAWGRGLPTAYGAAGYPVAPAYGAPVGYGYGRGLGFGRGFGRGRGRGFGRGGGRGRGWFGW